MDNINNLEDVDVVNPDGISYVDIGNIINVFSSTEYDSLEKAASEIIDNSIDAEANQIIIFINSSFNQTKGKNTLSEIAFLDNGEGMSPGRIQHIVGFGRSVGRGKNKIGKFGIGLNQASLYACDSFTVYSWTSPNGVYKEEFDAEEIKIKKIEKADVPVKTELPDYVKNFALFNSKFKEHGSLVVWSKIKQKHMAKPVTISKRLQNELGRIFRNYLWDNKVNIIIKTDSISNVHAIDPMFLLDNTVVLGDVNGHSFKVNEGEPLFELFENEMLENGCKNYEVPYYSSGGIVKYSNVVLRAAIIKEKFYYKAAQLDGIKQPGDTEIGAYTKELQKGITIIRNNREIDFNYFGFYDSNNQPADRWFKIELIFNEELDDVFDVSNNKQHVGIKKIPDSKIPDFKENDPNYPIWLRLNKDINKIISAMRTRNKALASAAKRSIVQPIIIDDKKIDVVDTEESLEEILDSFSEKNNNIEKDSNAEKNDLNDAFDTQNDQKYSTGNLNVKEEKEIISIEEDKFKISLSKMKIATFYDELENEILVEQKFDYKAKMYFITFNSTKIKDLPPMIEAIIAIQCKELCQYSMSSNEYRSLKKCIDNSLNFYINNKED